MEPLTTQSGFVTANNQMATLSLFTSNQVCTDGIRRPLDQFGLDLWHKDDHKGGSRFLTLAFIQCSVVGHVLAKLVVKPLFTIGNIGTLGGGGGIKILVY